MLNSDTRVISDQIELNMETPLLSDYQTSNGQPIGGHIHSFRRDWLKENCSSNVLNIITNGFVLPFLMKQLPVSSSNASSELEAGHRPKQVINPFLKVEKF